MSAGAAAGGGGVAAAGVASMAAGTPGCAPALLAAAGIAAAGGLFRVGYRTGQRTRLAAAAGVAAAGQLGLAGGVRASGRPVVEARSWRGIGMGSPRLVTVHVPRHLDLDDTDHAGVAVTVGAVFGAAYRVQRRRRGRLLLRRHTPTPVVPVDPVIARVHRTVAEMLGTAARVTQLQLGESGQPEQFDVHFDSGNRVVAEAWRARAERSLSTMLPGRWRARWDLERDRVHFELRPSLPERLPNPGITDADRRIGSRLPFGVDENGSTVYWQMETSPHMVVTGSTGVGKTVAVNGLLAGASNLGWPIRVCDPKRIEFLGMRNWPNVQIVATTVEEMVATVHDSWQLMEKRYRLIEQGKASEDDFEPTVLVLDEYRDMVALVDDWWASVVRPGVSAKLKLPTKCPVYGWVGSLARKGRSARVHVVLGTQRPDAEFLGGEMRDNFRARLSLGRLSPQGAQMMWEAPFIGVAVPAVRGRGTAAAGPSGIPTETQVYWTPDPRRATSPDDRELLAQLRPAQVIHGRQEVVWGDDVDFGNPVEIESIVWLRVRNAYLATIPPGVDPDADNHDADGRDDDASTDPAVATADTDPSPAGGAPSTAGSTVDVPRDAPRVRGELTPEQTPAGDGSADRGKAGDGTQIPPGRAAWVARLGPGRPSRAAGNTGGQVVHLAAHRHQAPPTAPTGDTAQEVPQWGGYDSSAEGGYEATETVAPSSLQPGDLVEVPVEGVETWAVIIDVTPDIEDEFAYAIDYLTDDGVNGTRVVPDDDLVRRRSPPEGS